VLGGAPYSYFRYETHLAALQALVVYDEIEQEFARTFGRTHSAVESYCAGRCRGGFFHDRRLRHQAKDAVDRLREAGEKVGLVRPRLMRPYPAEAIRRVLAGKQAVAVIDQNLSMGKGGVLHSELASVLYGHKGAPPIIASFIGGLGGATSAPKSSTRSRSKCAGRRNRQHARAAPAVYAERAAPVPQAAGDCRGRAPGPRRRDSMSEAAIKRMKDLPSTHLLGTGTPMCAGCGGLEALHEIYDILGTKTVFVNAAGCMTLLSVYPFTPFRGSWLYTAMASARPARRRARRTRHSN